MTPYANAFNIAVFFDDTEINTCSFILFLLCPKVYDKQKDSSLKMIFWHNLFQLYIECTDGAMPFFSLFYGFFLQKTKQKPST